MLHFATIITFCGVTFGLLSVKVGLPNNFCATFVGRFDNNVFEFTYTFQCCPFFCRKVTNFGVALEFKCLNIGAAFCHKKSKQANWLTVGAHFNLRTWRVSKTSFPGVCVLQTYRFPIICSIRRFIHLTLNICYSPARRSV